MQKFSSAGTFMMAWGSEGSAAGEFNNPRAIAISHDDIVYVSDVVNARVQSFDTSGTYLGHWGVPAATEGLDVDGDGNVWIVTNTGSLLQKRSPTGALLGSYGGTGSDDGQLNFPYDVAVAGSAVYVVEALNHRVSMFSINGSFLDNWGQNGSGIGEFGRPFGIAADAFGNVYVADQDNNRIQKFSGGPVPIVPMSWGQIKTAFAPDKRADASSGD